MSPSDRKAIRDANRLVDEALALQDCELFAASEELLDRADEILNTAEQSMSDTFTTGQWDRLRARRDKSQRAALDIIQRRHVPHLTPNDRVLLAQRLQAVQRYVTKARNALRGLSLS